MEPGRSRLTSSFYSQRARPRDPQLSHIVDICQGRGEISSISDFAGALPTAFPFASLPPISPMCKYTNKPRLFHFCVLSVYKGSKAAKILCLGMQVSLDFSDDASTQSLSFLLPSQHWTMHLLRVANSNRERKKLVFPRLHLWKIL